MKKDIYIESSWSITSTSPMMEAKPTKTHLKYSECKRHRYPISLQTVIKVKTRQGKPYIFMENGHETVRIIFGCNETKS